MPKKFFEGPEPGATKMPIIHVIFGPTGSGKTKYSLELAKEIGGEVISADSRQIYKGLTIGTGKILPEEMEGIPHYGLDLITPKESYTAALFGEYARKKIEEIHERGNVPIICGGTGLYIDTILYNLSVPKFESDPAFQSELETFRQANGNLALWERLASIDPDYAKEIHPNSYPYVCRAIEVKERTGKSKKDYRTERTSLYPTIWHWTYDENRENLYNRIDTRVEGMFNNGWIDEVLGLINNGYTKDDPGINTIGYKEIFELLEETYLKEGNMSKQANALLDSCIQLVQQHNRNYAKRQLTWFRRKSSSLHEVL